MTIQIRINLIGGILAVLVLVGTSAFLSSIFVRQSEAVGRRQQWRLKPTTDQLLQIEVVKSLDLIDQKIKRLSTEKLKAPVIAKSRLASKPRPSQRVVVVKRERSKATPTIWARAAEQNREQWRKWADTELARLRKKNAL